MQADFVLFYLQNELKSKWEFEKAILEESKNVAEKKYIEINEQVIAVHFVMICRLSSFSISFMSEVD